MGFFKKLFKKKKGGTKVGNLIRKIVKTGSGGKAGNGKNVEPSTEPPKISDQIIDSIGSVVGNLANEQLTPIISGALGTQNPRATNVLDAVTEPVVESALDSFWLSIKKRWYLIALPFGLIIFFIWYATKGRKQNRRTYR